MTLLRIQCAAAALVFFGAAGCSVFDPFPSRGPAASGTRTPSTSPAAPSSAPQEQVASQWVTTRPAAAVSAPQTSPVVVAAPSSQPAIIDAQAREQITRATLANITGRFGVDHEPRLNEYLVLVGSLVGMNAAGAEADYAYVLLDTDEPVSCAVWPKTICLSRGLVRQMSDESELAGVIAREVSNLMTGRALTAAGLPAPAAASSQPATRPAGQAAMLSAPNLDRYAARLTDVLLKDGTGREMEMAADVDGARFAAEARYAPDGFLRLLTRQKPAAGGTATSGGAWERIKALDENVRIIARAYPAADVRLPARFESYVRAAKATGGTAAGQ